MLCYVSLCYGNNYAYISYRIQQILLLKYVETIQLILLPCKPETCTKCDPGSTFTTLFDVTIGGLRLYYLFPLIYFVAEQVNNVSHFLKLIGVSHVEIKTIHCKYRFLCCRIINASIGKHLQHLLFLHERTCQTNNNSRNYNEVNNLQCPNS